MLDLGILQRVSDHSSPEPPPTDIIKEKVLNGELDKWLEQVSEAVEPYPIKGGKAIIAPSVG